MPPTRHRSSADVGGCCSCCLLVVFSMMIAADRLSFSLTPGALKIGSPLAHEHSHGKSGGVPRRSRPHPHTADQVATVERGFVRLPGGKGLQTTPSLSIAGATQPGHGGQQPDRPTGSGRATQWAVGKARQVGTDDRGDLGVPHPPSGSRRGSSAGRWQAPEWRRVTPSERVGCARADVVKAGPPGAGPCDPCSAVAEKDSIQKGLDSPASEVIGLRTKKRRRGSGHLP